MKKVIGWSTGLGVGILGLAAAGLVAFAVAMALLLTSFAGTLGAIFADESIQQDYGFFGCGLEGDGGGGGEGTPMTGSQTEYVRTIVGTGKALGVPVKGQIIAVMVAMQESSIKNYANSGKNVRGYSIGTPQGTQFWLDAAKLSLKYPHDAVGNDADSVGLFQQRASAGWADGGGVVAAKAPDKAIKRLLDPQWGAQAFYGGPGGPANRGLLDVSGWEAMAPTVAAQTVQGSAFPDAYAKWEGQATQLVKGNQDAPKASLAGGGSSSSSGGEGAGSSEGPASAAGCGDTSMAGLVLGSGTVADMFAAAKAVEGTPYSWGGGELDGPGRGVNFGGRDGTNITGFDCSGLVRFMVYQGTGGSTTLPRTSGQQYNATKGKSVTFANLQPGDLMFYGSPGNVYHVSMFAGNGMMWEAPTTGDVVALRPARDLRFFAGTRLALKDESNKKDESGKG